MSNRDDYFERNTDSQKKYKNHLEKATRRQKLKSVNKNFKRNQQSKPIRRRDWLPDAATDWDDLDYESYERVMPRNESERRRRIEKNIFQTTQTKAGPVEPTSPEVAAQRGLVVAVSQGLCRVEVGSQTLTCHIRGTLKATETAYTNAVAVGDAVFIGEDGTGGGVIEAVLPRRSILARPDVFLSHRQQIIVANADQLLIVSAWREPVIWLELIDRYLIAAERHNLPPIICLNKLDLVEDEADCQATLQPYRDLGYPVMLTSALTGAGIDELQRALRGRTTALAGLSGVGKSSLLRAIQPGLELRTGAVSETSGEGRHTTTQATLIRLEAQTTVIDTPGIREFGLSGLRQPDLARFFPEITAVADQCRFTNCTHLTEPGCAAQTMVEAGRMAPSRYHSYRQIYGTLPG